MKYYQYLNEAKNIRNIREESIYFMYVKKYILKS
jgi:hypothetical protein